MKTNIRIDGANLKTQMHCFHNGSMSMLFNDFQTLYTSNFIQSVAGKQWLSWDEQHYFSLPEVTTYAE